MAKLKKSINAFGVFSIATGAMISSGIFILPGLAFARVGSQLFLSYLLAGVLGLIGILSMIELATAMPKAGGDYFYINRSFGPLIGSISGFLGWFALSLKSAFAIFGISEIVFVYLNINPLVSGFVLCALFVILNIVGAKEAAIFQVILVLALLALMVTYVVSGLPFINLEHFTPIKDADVNAVFVTSGFIFISFGGLLKIASVSEEVSNPKRNLPIGMISSIVTVTILYVLMVVVMTGTMDAETFGASLTPVADSARIALGNLGYNIILVASVLAFFTTANAGILAASRYPLALSHDRLIPPIFGRLNARKSTPVLAIILTGVVIFISLLLPLETLVKAASTVILSSYVLTNLSVIVFRESKLINYLPSFKAPFYPWLQVFSVLLFSFFIIDLGLSAIEISIVLFLFGLISYLVYGRRKAGKESALIHLMRRIADDRLANGTIEDDFREIIINRDNIQQDNFDRLIKGAEIIDLDGKYDFATMMKIIARQIAGNAAMPADQLVEAFLARQENSNTALSNFLAIPHIVIDGSDKMFMYVIRARDGIKFTPEQKEVKAIFLLGGTKDVRVLHLKTIAAIASLISEKDFEQRWIQAASPVDLKNLLLVNERRRYH